MWIREVNFPRPLIDAHRAGGLVLFVGAGASMDPPSSLPNFRTLASDIARESQVAVTDKELANPDVLLGRLMDLGVDVHLRIRSRVGSTNSSPNRLHRAITAVAMAGDAFRLVTTNYDGHLSAALLGGGATVAEYMAPALPLGNAFSGLVYLHGNVRQEPFNLIVTDKDFGHAYLTDAWAARFLERMFARYAVLFLGYSHSDVVMRYLARALGPDSQRYILTPDPSAQEWRTLGITPIGYPLLKDSHGALVDALEGWASLASMGLLDHRQRVATLVSAPPSGVPEEVSYLESLLGDREKLRFFVELARGEEWLSWAGSHLEFRALFDPSVTPTDCTATLAYWFADRFVTDESLTVTALGVVHDAGGRLGPTAWGVIGQRINALGSPRPPWLTPWIVLMIQNAPRYTSEVLDYALCRSVLPADRAIALLLFDFLVEPQVALEPSYGGAATARFDVDWRGTGYWLSEAWRTVFVPHLADVAPEILAIVDRHLRRAHLLLTGVGTATAGWDPVSRRRSAIDPSSQDLHDDPLNVLIDAARDCLEALLNARSHIAVAMVNAWASADAPTLRRLAIHGWSHRGDVDSTGKLEWLRERGWLYDEELRHEVFHLLEVALPSADPEAAAAIVADVLAGPEDIDDENLRAYIQYNALSWIVTHAPGLQSAHRARDELHAAHPEFAESEHPNFGTWFESGPVLHRPPMTTKSFHEGIALGAEAVVSELLSYEGISLSLDGSTWNDALTLLSNAVREQPADGLAVLGTTAGAHTGILGAVVRGWSEAPLDTSMSNRILDRLLEVDLQPVADDTSRMLSDGGQSEAHPTVWHQHSRARRLAAEVWAGLESEPVAADVDDWLFRAINHSAGHLALFWVRAVQGEWNAAGDSWLGIPAELSAELEVLIAGDDDRAAMAQVIFASQIFFLFRADPAWCEVHVLPLLDWEIEERARRTWQGYLTWGRWDNKLLSVGLFDHYLAAMSRVDDLRDEAHRQLLNHLAGLALYSELDPLSWLGRLTVTLDEPARVEWMGQVTVLLAQMPAPAVEHQWQRWMQRYWQNRLESVPTQLTVEEASTLSTWVPYLTDSITDGVALTTASPAGLISHSLLLHYLNEERLDRAPAAFAELIAHLLRGTNQGSFWDCHYIERIVNRVRDHADPAHITTIIEEALRLGCVDATQW